MEESHEDKNHSGDDSENAALTESDADIEREFEEDMANATAVRMKLTEAQALDSNVTSADGLEDEPDEASLLFEEVLQGRDNMVRYEYSKQ
jgi:hypothetical protein